MTNQRLVPLLVDQLRRYRGWTQSLLDETPEDWVYRRVDWTECTIGWHAGHLAWKQDAYGAIYFGAEQRLDSDWKRLFYSADPLDLAAAPPVAELRRVVTEVFERFASQVAALDDAALPRASSDWPDGTVLGAITNVIFHEGEHLAGIEALRWYLAREEQ
jgi:hypothetical protein